MHRISRGARIHHTITGVSLRFCCWRGPCDHCAALAGMVFLDRCSEDSGLGRASRDEREMPRSYHSSRRPAHQSWRSPRPADRPGRRAEDPARTPRPSTAASEVFVPGEIRVTSFTRPEQNTQGHAHDPSRRKRARVRTPPACTQQTRPRKDNKAPRETGAGGAGWRARGLPPSCAAPGALARMSWRTVAPRGCPRDWRTRA